MGATHSFHPDISDSTYYTISLYETRQLNAYDGHGERSKHVVSLAHPKEGEFWLLDADGVRLCKLALKGRQVNKDLSYVYFYGQAEEGKWFALLPICGVPNTYLLRRHGLTHESNLADSIKVLHETAVFCYPADVEKIKIKSNAQQQHASPKLD